MRSPTPTSVLFFAVRFSRLSESSETEWDWVKVNGLSDELLPTPVSSVSADSSFGEGTGGKRKGTFSFLGVLVLSEWELQSEGIILCYY